MKSEEREPEEWIVDLPDSIHFTYVWDPSKREYVCYWSGIGIFEFDKEKQRYELNISKLYNSEYVQKLLKNAKEHDKKRRKK